MDVGVHVEPRSQSLDQAIEGREAAMSKVVVLAAETLGRRMRQQHIETALAMASPQARKDLDWQRPPSHLRRRVLVGTGSVAHRTAKARDTKAGRVLDPAVYVHAALRPPRGPFGSKGRPWIVERRRDRVVVARHVQQRHVEAAGHVLQGGPRPIPSPQPEVGLQLYHPVPQTALGPLLP